MSTPIRYPKITGRTPEEKMAQMESWLRQLVDHLNYALPRLEQSASGAQANADVQNYRNQRR